MMIAMGEEASEAWGEERKGELTDFAGDTESEIGRLVVVLHVMLLHVSKVL